MKVVKNQLTQVFNKLSNVENSINYDNKFDLNHYYKLWYLNITVYYWRRKTKILKLIAYDINIGSNIYYKLCLASTLIKDYR